MGYVAEIFGSATRPVAIALVLLTVLRLITPAAQLFLVLIVKRLAGESLEGVEIEIVSGKIRVLIRGIVHDQPPDRKSVSKSWMKRTTELSGEKSHNGSSVIGPCIDSEALELAEPEQEEPDQQDLEEPDQRDLEEPDQQA